MFGRGSNSPPVLIHIPCTRRYEPCYTRKKGDTVLDSGKVFTVGGEVFANHACDYEGLFAR